MGRALFKVRERFVMFLESICAALDLIPGVGALNQKWNHPLFRWADALDARWGTGVMKPLDGYH
jgi:hypothetical protein